MGFYVKDVLITHGQGPSEVLLNTDIKEKVQAFTKNIVNPDYKVPVVSNRCPICFGESFNLLNNSKIRCSVCDLTGEIIENQNEVLISFPADPINQSRWSAENLKDHMENWVEGSVQTYKGRMREIMKLRNSIKTSINTTK
ncbi:MAG: NADPH-dependent FMN reductase [uncultured bacterium]|nr:MAG: NADPH-dependent FMN reductase [uncultured bacterium]